MLWLTANPHLGSFAVKGGDISTVLEAGLPNITGSFQADQNHIGDICNNAFSRTTGTGYTHVENMVPDATYFIELHASLSNPIYGATTTVQPPALQLIPQIRY